MAHQHAPSQAADAPTPSKFYTPKQVAALLCVSERVVTAWVQRGGLTAVQYGRLIRIRQEDLDAFGKVLNKRPAPEGTPAPAE